MVLNGKFCQPCQYHVPVQAYVRSRLSLVILHNFVHFREMTIFNQFGNSCETTVVTVVITVLSLRSVQT